MLRKQSLLDTRKLINYYYRHNGSKVELRKHNSKIANATQRQCGKAVKKVCCQRQIASRAPGRLRIFMTATTLTGTNTRGKLRWSNMADTYFYGLGRRKVLQQAFDCFPGKGISLSAANLPLSTGWQQNLTSRSESTCNCQQAKNSALLS